MGFPCCFSFSLGGRLGGGNETRTARAGVRQSTVANRATALQRGNPIEPGLSRAEEIECRYLRKSRGKSGIEDKQIQPSIDLSLFHIKEKKRRNQNRYQKVKYKKKNQNQNKSNKEIKNTAAPGWFFHGNEWEREREREENNVGKGEGKKNERLVDGEPIELGEKKRRREEK